MSTIFTTAPEDSGQRLDILLKKTLPEYSRAQLQKLVKAGACTVNGATVIDPDFRPDIGSSVELAMPEAPSHIEPSQGKIEVLWRDEHLALLNKPAGLTVHPCPSCQDETLVHRMLAYFPELAKQYGERPGIVHRLDKDTSGIILIALTEQARLALAKAFADRRVHKEYLALTAGNPPESGQCLEPVGRHPTLKTRMAIAGKNHGGRSAHTQWRKLWQGYDEALLNVRIFTGRTHQIRVHLAHLGFPILGDSTYAPAQVAAKAPRQMLHAWQIAFTHPFTNKKMRFAVAPPQDFFQAALANNQQMERVVVTGNQGCGKSSFCHQLSALDIPCISADNIVERLYAPRGMANEWIATHIDADTIDDAGAVDKAALFQILKQKPHLRQELEKAVHGMVLTQIEKFWNDNARNRISCAEIPLYFESGYQTKIQPEPWVVGISCPQSIRWQRLASIRGWSKDKIAEIEAWQWPQERKMAACNEIITNAGTPEELGKKALNFLSNIRQRIADREANLLAKLHALCAIQTGFAPEKES